MEEFKPRDIFESSQLMINTGAYVYAMTAAMKENKKLKLVDEDRFLDLLEKSVNNAFKILRGQT